MFEAVIVLTILSAIAVTATIVLYGERKNIRKANSDLKEQKAKIAEEAKGLYLLLGNDWKITDRIVDSSSEAYRYAQYQAPDEGIQRGFADAVKRQTLLSECKRYNVPMPPAIEVPETTMVEVESALVKHLSK